MVVLNARLKWHFWCGVVSELRVMRCDVMYCDVGRAFRRGCGQWVGDEVWYGGVGA